MKIRSIAFHFGVGVLLISLSAVARNFNGECKPSRGTGEIRFEGEIKVTLLRIEKGNLPQPLQWKSLPSSPKGIRIAFVSTQSLVQMLKNKSIKILKQNQLILKDHATASRMDENYSAKVDASSDFKSVTVNLKYTRLPGTKEESLGLIVIPYLQHAILTDSAGTPSVVISAEPIRIAVGAVECL